MILLMVSTVSLTLGRRWESLAAGAGFPLESPRPRAPTSGVPLPCLAWSGEALVGVASVVYESGAAVAVLPLSTKASSSLVDRDSSS